LLYRVIAAPITESAAMPHSPSDQVGLVQGHASITLAGDEEPPHVRSMVEQYDHDVVDIVELPFEAAESPWSKRLRLEEGQAVQKQEGKVRNEGNSTTVLFTRPASHGKDVQVPQFAPRPPFRKIKGRVMGDVPKITFAPQRRQSPVAERGITTTERPRSHSPTAR
jgi:hypothetical protein